MKPINLIANDAAVVHHLAKRGQLRGPRVTRLLGGVSGATFLVETVPSRVVVKQSLERLQVDADWRAKPDRSMTEAGALRLLHALTPEHTPDLLDADPTTNTLVMTAAPADWVNWREVLLGTCADPTSGPVDVASQLGAVLGCWHRSTRLDQDAAATFGDYEAFDQLRINPFHRTVARAHPGQAGAITECARELLSRRDCLVHGDFSPKNVLVGDTGLMVLDFEVAHFGAAIFDLAFMSCHLALKALHLPDQGEIFQHAAATLVRTYSVAAAWPGGGEAITARLGWHTACLMLSRVDGLSRATYLSQSTADVIREISTTELGHTDTSIEALWNLVASSFRKACP